MVQGDLYFVDIKVGSPGYLTGYQGSSYSNPPAAELIVNIQKNCLHDDWFGV